MSIVGHVRGGVVVLDGDAHLEDGTRVAVQVLPAAPSLATRMRNLVGRTDLPEDASDQHDHYLLGTPRRDPA